MSKWLLKDFEFGRIDKDIVWFGLLPVSRTMHAVIEADRLMNKYWLERMRAVAEQMAESLDREIVDERAG